ncbi:sigma-54-dependent Fis family transcriptional regulator [Clostridium grantii]|uniref:PAS domain S-box-containing protein n=1 Tax=Clostridium grantii DSM 8605 TaxID=1121316 RepID=A0A1M5RQT2_9CLOT|nr:sigma-54-dependent Fis family transcriptional regulator [Clostridium grantii]SHH28223.1 PAS domain S-box-containing protein [Clostridium grantii DSM 8605]
MHKDFILNSHKRCSECGVNGNIAYSNKILIGNELKNKLEENRQFILTAYPFMEHIYNFVKGSHFFAILTEHEGCILNVFGDEKIIEEAYNLKMIPGAYMDEKSIGTNAMSLVLTEKKPIQISGEEHYINAYHKWTCSAAPIKDSTGKIIGILNLTGYCKNVHLHTLGMVVAASYAIEAMLQSTKDNNSLTKAKKHIEQVFDSISAGIITTDLKGDILNVNKTGLDMFGYDEKTMKKFKIWQLLNGYHSIIEAIEKGKKFTDEDVNVKTKKNKLQYNLSVYPVRLTSDIISEYTFVFVDVKRRRKLAGKILSNGAIYTFDKVIGNNDKFLKTIDYSKKIADSSSTILISGESGTGKEVFAQSIHNYSNRKEMPFIAVNCGAIPRTLIESELFGYEEGAFTGAKKGGNLGKFELADGGTIFLDEIGEMPSDMQIKLLRVIEEGIITKIGGRSSLPVDIRIIAATNKNLKSEVDKGNFRKDLFYRLNVLPLLLPPLRERKDDIANLIEYFMKKTCKRLNKREVKITEEYMNALRNYQWPGNIRELENLVELIVNTECLSGIDLSKQSDLADIKLVSLDLNVGDEELSLKEAEKKHITKVLNKYEGNVALSAKALKIGRNTLYRKVKEYNIRF